MNGTFMRRELAEGKVSGLMPLAWSQKQRDSRLTLPSLLQEPWAGQSMFRSWFRKHHRWPSSGSSLKRHLLPMMALLVAFFFVFRVPPQVLLPDYWKPTWFYAPLNFSYEVELASAVPVMEPTTVIPNIVHFIHGLTPDFGKRPFGLVEYLAVKAAHDVIKPSTIYLHYMYRPEGEWFERARPFLTLVPVTDIHPLQNVSMQHYAHLADVLRLLVLIQHGGIYLDMDVLALRDFTPLRTQHKVTLGREQVRNTPLVRWPDPGGVANAVIVAPVNASFLHRWLATYATFQEKDWATHSVTIPYVLARSHRFDAELHVEGPRAFYYPTWSPDDPSQGLPRLYERARRYGARKAYLFDDGNYAVHLWRTKAAEVYPSRDLFSVAHICNHRNDPPYSLSTFQRVAQKIYGEC
ncbi:hypothetical protein CCYA_CCYA17G4375 [Cyanidiococcus yangmingshanensis]|nr:hypothetical protein CCYA_CCYA17G4375 [Cyanidiococcus yangmingshanensis]